MYMAKPFSGIAEIASSWRISVSRTSDLKPRTKSRPKRVSRKTRFHHSMTIMRYIRSQGDSYIYQSCLVINIKSSRTNSTNMKPIQATRGCRSQPPIVKKSQKTLGSSQKGSSRLQWRGSQRLNQIMVRNHVECSKNSWKRLKKCLKLQDIQAAS